MPDYAALERLLIDTLRLVRRPVAVAFRDAAPAGVPPLEGSQPSSCSFWRLAAEGKVFHTVPSDHYNCPVGSYTHNIPLPAGREGELTRVLGLMGEVGYIRMEEVPGVPRLPRTPGVAVYAPLGQAPVAPDVVIVAGAPGGLMLLHEAATRATRPVTPLLGRPTCMAIPAAAAGGGVASSLGCIGNRVYTGIADEQFYTVVSGADLEGIVGELSTIASANATLADYHRERRTTLSTA